MKVEEYINQYKVFGKDYIAKHIKNTYVPYTQKMAEAQKIVDLTMYKEVNGAKVFWHNTPMQYNLFIQRLISNYTEIEIENPVEDYDALNKEGLINEIVKAIPENEYAEFQTILNMTVDDELNNVRSLPSYIDTKVDALMMLLKGVAENEMFQQTIQDLISNPTDGE